LLEGDEAEKNGIYPKEKRAPFTFLANESLAESQKRSGVMARIKQPKIFG
jgi:hypothetical protein